jgi:hypothetical protein
MLKITVTGTPAKQRRVLEGRLTRPWVAALRLHWCQTRRARQGRTCVVDLHDVPLARRPGDDAHGFPHHAVPPRDGRRGAVCRSATDEDGRDSQWHALRCDTLAGSDGSHQPSENELAICSGLRTVQRGLANKGLCRPALCANTPTGGPALCANRPTLVCKRLVNRSMGQHALRTG